jgi:hypothetical protein
VPSEALLDPLPAQLVEVVKALWLNYVLGVIRHAEERDQNPPSADPAQLADGQVQS